MGVLTGADGQLKYQGVLCGKTRDWSLSISKDALETSHLGTYDRTYVEGLRGATGSATLLYDTDSLQSRALMQAILANGSSDELTFVFNKTVNTSAFLCKGIITSVSQSISTGAVQSVSINFTVSDKFEDGEF